MMMMRDRLAERGGWALGGDGDRYEDEEVGEEGVLSCEVVAVTDRAGMGVAVQREVQRALAEVLEGYVWHGGVPLELELATRTGRDGAATIVDEVDADEVDGGVVVLSGSIDVGEDVEEEWLVVGALLALTRAPLRVRAECGAGEEEEEEIEVDVDVELAARVCDGDGEFPLIEAAMALPDWVRPEIMQRRVWLFRGGVHLLAPADLDNAADDVVTCAVAARTLVAATDTTPTTRASDDVEAAVLARCGGPDVRAHKQDLLHRCWCIVPQEVAAALRRNPLLLGATLSSCMLSDVAERRCCVSMPRFRYHVGAPEHARTTKRRSQSGEAIKITFSKHLYAQLQSLELPVPRVLRPIIQDVEEMQQQEQQPQRQGWTRAAAERGIQLACAFEVVYQMEQARLRRVATSAAPPGAYKGTPVVDALDANVPTGSAVCDGAAAAAAAAAAVMDNDSEDDDDSWMHVTSSDMEALLKSYAARHPEPATNATTKTTIPVEADADAASVEKLSTIFQTMSAFLDDESAGLDGAEVAPPHNNDNDNDNEDEDDDAEDDYVADSDDGEAPMAGTNGDEEPADGEDWDSDDGPPFEATGDLSAADDVGVVGDLLRSNEAEMGVPGPASTLLRQLGVALPVAHDT